VQHRASAWITKAPTWIRSTVPARVRSLVDTVRDLDVERINLSCRGRTALVASVALVGTGLAGAVTTSVYASAHDGGPTTNHVIAVDASRVAADRADRATRPDASTSPTAAASVPAVASPAPAAPTAAAPAPAVAAPAPAPKPDWVAPMGHYEMTSCYGPRWGTEHQGIDFANVAGTPELAAGAGTVLWAGWNDGGYGNFVVIDHGNSTWTLYGHAEQVLVSPGQHVEAGQEIALEGTTGDSTGPHLHFEVWNGLWSRIEPASFLRAHGVSLPGC
jgi:murein DD-endopeptidase MepM/ murein hydrolase activator NlpD